MMVHCCVNGGLRGCAAVVYNPPPRARLRFWNLEELIGYRAAPTTAQVEFVLLLTVLNLF